MTTIRKIVPIVISGPQRKVPVRTVDVFRDPRAQALELQGRAASFWVRASLLREQGRQLEAEAFELRARNAERIVDGMRLRKGWL